MAYPVQHNITQAFGLFMRASDNWDKFLCNNELQKYLDSFWFDRIPKQAFPLFSGASQKSGFWRPGPLAVTNLAKWKDPVRSRLPGTDSADDPGVNACVDYSGEVVDFGGWEVWENSSKVLNLYSPSICVHDVAEITQAKEQLAYMITHMKKKTVKEHAAWNRENYLRTTMYSGHNFIMTTGGMGYEGEGGPKFYYDPFIQDSSGNSHLYYRAGTDVSTLDWSYLTFQQEYLSAQCPDAATSRENGGRQYTLLTSLSDFQKMVDSNAELREDYHYAMPKVQIEDYHTFSMYRGFTLAEDVEQARFEPVGIVTSNGSNVPDGKGGWLAADVDYVKCVRVSPETTGRTILEGRQVTMANPAYFRAPLRIAIIFIKDVFVNQIRPTLGDLGSGMKFGAVPGYNGEFLWQNLKDPVTNPYGEIGNFASRFWTYIKPMDNYLNTVAFMYRSCHIERITLCETDGTTTTAVALSETIDESTDIDATNFTVSVTLVSKLAGGDGSEVEVTPVSGTGYEGYILDASAAPTYVLGFTETNYAFVNEDTTMTTAATVQIK